MKKTKKFHATVSSPAVMPDDVESVSFLLAGGVCEPQPLAVTEVGTSGQMFPAENCLTRSPGCVFVPPLLPLVEEEAQPHRGLRPQTETNLRLFTQPRFSE